MPHPSLEQAAAWLYAGQAEEAAAACHALLDTGEDPSALHLLGVALTRLARPAEAVPRLLRARDLAPESPAIRLALGNAHRRLGNHAEARLAYEETLQREPGSISARYNLAESLRALGEPGLAARHFGAVALANPMDFEASQCFVACVAAISGAVPAAPTPASDRLGPVTVGMCTIHPERAERVRAHLERALAPSTPRFDIVRDPRSLAAAYNAILDRAPAGTVILCHDDIDVLSANIHAALAEALASADLVGIAGAQRVSGPAVLWAGHPHVHGWLGYPRDEGFEAAALSLRRRIVAGMQALDGVFVAVGPRARAHRYDERTFDGFHFYDLDYSYRAHLAGLRLAVTTQVLLLHESRGNFGDDWQRYAERFRAKFPELSADAGQPHWYGAPFSDVGAMVAFFERLDAQIGEAEQAS